jgi:hypothetical protein
MPEFVRINAPVSFTLYYPCGTVYTRDNCLLMEIIQVTVYELAKSIEGQAFSLREEGALTLIDKARKLNQAEREWRSTPILQSPDGVRVRAAIEEFDKEWSAYCARSAKKA